VNTVWVPAPSVRLIIPPPFLRSKFGVSLRPPGVVYYVIVPGGLIVSLGIVASSFPIIERITGPEIARND
jgi:hypothetical protein